MGFYGAQFSPFFWAFSAPIGTYPLYRFLHRTAIRILIGSKYDVFSCAGGKTAFLGLKIGVQCLSEY
jgi:hypothetical protein